MKFVFYQICLSYQLCIFVWAGLLFGNLSALAMRPQGHIAGIGATVVTSLPTLVSMPFGALVGYSFDGTLNSLTAAYAVCGAAAFATMLWAESGRSPQPDRVL